MKRTSGKIGERMKRKILFAVCLSMVVLFTGCRKQILPEKTAGHTTTTTEESEITEGLLITGEPETTESLEEGAERETETEIPVVSGGGKQENIDASEEKSEYVYQFYEMPCVAETEHIYEIDRNGVYRLNFTEQYNRVIFALPEGINMELCDRVTVKAKSEYGSIWLKLYDETVYINPWLPAVYEEAGFIGEGVCEFTLYPELTCDVWGVEIMSGDEVEDFSQYKAEAYSVTFYRKTQD